MSCTHFGHDSGAELALATGHKPFTISKIMFLKH